MIGIDGYINFSNKYKLGRKKLFIDKDNLTKINQYKKNNFYLEYLNKNKLENHYIENDIFFLVVGSVYEQDNDKISISTELCNYYKKNNLINFSKKNGSFIFIIKDKNKLIIGCDQNCYIPCYYYYSNDFFIFSYNIFLIKSAIPFFLKPNVKKISQIILTGGIILDDESKIKGIYKLLPGNIIIITPQNKKIIESDFFGYKIKNNSVNYHIENVANNLSNSIKNLKENRIGIGLSGGLDSRILLAALKNKKKIFPHIYGLSGFNEVRIAREICKSYKLKLIEIKVKKKKYLDYIDEFFLYSNAECTITTSPQFYIYKNLKKIKKFNTITFGSALDCIIGDAWQNNKIAAIKSSKKLSQYYVNEYIFKYTKKDFQKLFINKSLANSVYEDGKYKIEKILNKIKAENIFDLNASFFLETRGKRWYNSSLIYPLFFFNLQIPYYDKYFLKSASEIPAEYRKNDNFRVKLLKYLDNKISKINYNKSLSPASYEFPLNKINIYKQKVEEDTLFKKWIKSEYKNKFSSKLYDANFLEWLISNDTFKNFFTKKIFFLFNKSIYSIFRKKIIYKILVNLKKNKNDLKSLLIILSMQCILIFLDKKNLNKKIICNK
jgi:tRNA(Ile)-lysidine synthase TilS/MesJ